MATTIISAAYTSAGQLNLWGNDDTLLVVEGATYVSNSTGVIATFGTTGQRIQIDGNLIAAGDSALHGIITSGQSRVTVGEEGQVITTQAGYAAVNLGGQTKSGDLSFGSLTNAGELLATVGAGVVLVNGENSVSNIGLISGSYGVFVASGSAGDVISNTGTISGSSYGIQSAGTGTHLVNDGTISSNSQAVNGVFASINNTGLISAKFSAVNLTSEATVSNSGTILSAAEPGILAQYGLTLTLTNSGKISGVYGIYSNGTTSITNTGVIESTAADGASAFAIELVDARNDSIVNRGLIDGNVNLGAGNDLFDTRDGRVLGMVSGSTGNDAYMVSSTDIQLSESADQGVDTVSSTISWKLGANFENLTLLGNAAINAKGNVQANILTGNDGDNRLDGAGGTDTMIGGDGDDTYVTDGGDTITEAADEGTDTVRSSATITLSGNVENLVLTGSTAINGFGNAEDNTITGNRAANQITGGAGEDTLIGGRGNDVYTIDAEDVVIETAGGGSDTVRADFSAKLGENVENLQLIGTGGFSGTGNAAGNVLNGNSGNNRLEGLGGNDLLNGATGTDTLVGGTGDDIYFTDGGDTIIERTDEGIDSVQSSATHSLSGNVENLLLTGSAAINGTGNSLSNIIVGNSAANTLDGGAGNDTLTGGGGADAFLFKAALVPANADRIRDFDVPADTIQLENAVFTGLAAGRLSASAFVKNTSGNAADASDRIIYESDTGKLFFDSDGTGGAAKVHFATLGTGLGLTAADFLVV